MTVLAFNTKPHYHESSKVQAGLSMQDPVIRSLFCSEGTHYHIRQIKQNSDYAFNCS